MKAFKLALLLEYPCEHEPRTIIQGNIDLDDEDTHARLQYSVIEQLDATKRFFLGCPVCGELPEGLAIYHDAVEIKFVKMEDLITLNE